MIKATDLRVGNLMKNPKGISHVYEILQTAVILKIGKELSAWNYNEIEPIPITEELLINAGARKIGETSYNLHEMQINFTDGKWIEYVHQIELTGIHHLQNVFYFTRGKELIFEGLN